jgi:hypothetical protein
MYKVVRHYFNFPNSRVIKKNLTLEEAQAYCRDPESSSQTCTTAKAKRRTHKYGAWFDGYTEM